jgi:hypothetical protein
VGLGDCGNKFCSCGDRNYLGFIGSRLMVCYVTTECPTCKDNWTREEPYWDQMPLAMMALAMCPKCDTGELVTIEYRGHLYERRTGENDQPDSL